ncbi:ATPase, partial [Candidatus Woesearchaeota archaeon]|nr:ATPase [Candidatus Woesearchaeota archaeon]
MEHPEVKLQVREALQEEAYRGIVRIDSQTMRDIGVRPGDVVEIEGTRKTVGVVDRAYPTDVGQAVIRMDGVMRRNSRTSLGEYVLVRRAEVREARHITLAPAQSGLTIQADPLIFKRGLLGRAVVKGDQVALGGNLRRKRRAPENVMVEDIFDIFEDFGGFAFSSFKFIVVGTEPKQPVLVTENTEVTLNPKAIENIEEKVVEVTYEDIGGLTDEVKKIREMAELPLKHPELFERLGIQPPKGVLLH